MALKFRKASPQAAYEIAVGVTNAEQASEAGLAVVECDAFGNPTAYGRYVDAPDGGPLGITSAKPADTEVVAGGTVSPGSDNAPIGGQKSSIVNVNDPFVHGGGEEVHADGGEPPVRDLAAEEREQAEIAEKSIEAASKPRRAK